MSPLLIRTVLGWARPTKTRAAIHLAASAGSRPLGRLPLCPPPTSQASSPATSATPTFTVSWSGSADVVSYDVQVQADGGPWQDWQVGVTITSAQYTGAWGHTYGFRCRARDAAGNQEPYPATADTVTTLGALVRKYYYANAKRVALREGTRGTPGVLHYLHSDHLGSTSLVTNATGGEVGRQRYFPYGGQRPATGSLPTDYRFTGQRHEGTIALYDYGARYYDPLLGRFMAADTVVPEPGNPQALNRFSYVLNNPFKYTDPTGHWVNNDWIESDWDWQAKTPWQGKERGEDWTTYFNRVGCHGDNGEGLLLAAAAPFIGVGLIAGGELAYIGGAAVGKAAIQFIIRHPVKAAIAKAVVEEGVESAITGTPYDPGMVALDLVTQFGDDMVPRRGQKVYRVWGAEPQTPDVPGSGPWGYSWSPVDPSTEPNYRRAAGLPSGGKSGAYNAGRFVSEGIINDPSGIRVRRALALDGNPGGLAEFLVPDPRVQITLTGVSGVNPSY